MGHRVSKGKQAQLSNRVEQEPLRTKNEIYLRFFDEIYLNLMFHNIQSLVS